MSTRPTCHSSRLTMRIFLSLILGITVGLLCHYFELENTAAWIKPLGEIFFSFLKMMLGPLFFTTIYMAIVNLGSSRTLGLLGSKTILYYVLLGGVALTLGLTLMNFFQPGTGFDSQMQLSGVTSNLLSDMDKSNGGYFKSLLSSIPTYIPANPIAALYEGNIPKIIMLSTFFGIVSLHQKEALSPVVKLMESLEKIAVAGMSAIMYFAPIGIFALIVDVVTELGVDSIYLLVKYIAVVVLGLFIFAALLILVCAWLSKISPTYLVRMFAPFLLASFSTCSSAVTIPITVSVAENDLKINSSTAKFVISLGSIINISGTALYETLAVIFVAQIYGLNLDMQSQLIVFLVSSFSAMGAASIPNAGIVTMSVILNTLHFPLDAIGLVLSVDCILDQTRTAVNVLGDFTGALVVEKLNLALPGLGALRAEQLSDTEL